MAYLNFFLKNMMIMMYVKCIKSKTYYSLFEKHKSSLFSSFPIFLLFQKCFFFPKFS